MDRFVQSTNNLRLGKIINNGINYHHIPLGDGYLDSVLDELRNTLASANRAMDAGNYDASIRSIAYFHWLFVHTHPFININNSVAMNIVNAYLLRAKGRFLPHLLLDLIALRTDPEDYITIFYDSLDRYGLSKENSAANSIAMNHIMDYQTALHAEEKKLNKP
jgi:Fic family protein